MLRLEDSVVNYTSAIRKRGTGGIVGEKGGNSQNKGIWVGGIIIGKEISFNFLLQLKREEMEF